MRKFQDINFHEISRINVVGTSGCGKTTFSKKLAGILNIPYLEMDQIFWKPQWTMPGDDEFFHKLKSALNQEKWILDGNYFRSIPIAWENVELIIWLDYSFGRVLSQTVKRSVVRAITRKELWVGTGNRESFRKSFFSRDSIILWSIKTFKRKRIRYNKAMTDEKYSHIKFIRLSSPKETERFLKNIQI